MKKTIFLFFFLLATSAIYAQSGNSEEAKGAYYSAKIAYEEGNYKTALSKLTEAEQLLGGPQPITTALRAQCYYQQKEYQKCVSAADIFFSLNQLQNKLYEEICVIKSDAQSKIREAEEAERARLAAAEAERKRKEEAARAQAAHEREASDKWQEIKETTDLSVLQSFLSKYSDTPSKAAAQTRYDDERAWQTAKNEHTLSGYERYLNGSTTKNYRQEAREILERDFPAHFKKYAENSDISGMEDMYNRYIKLFPNGSEKRNMESAMCNAYFAKGKALIKSNDRSVISSGKNLLEKSKAYSCPNKEAILSLQKRADAKYKYLNLANEQKIFIGYSADVNFNLSPAKINCPLGLTVGGLKPRHRGPSVYAVARMNTAFFKSASDYDPKSTTRPNMLEFWDNSKYANWISTGVTKVSNGQFVLGLTQQIAYPLYIYAGGGLSMITNKYEYEEYSNKDFDKIVYYKRKDRDIIGDKKRFFGLFDAGVILNYKWFYLSCGVSTSFTTEQTYMTFGGGFTF